MKPTGDVQPRRDGWFEHRAKWDEVVVGTVLADTQTRKKRWEIVDIAMGTPVAFGYTLWMRAREQTTGEEFTVVPRHKNTWLTVLTQDPADTYLGEATPPSDADAIMLLVEKLGATHLASRDEKTGEITCPDYTYESHLEGPANISRGLIEHMTMAHGMTVPAGLDLLETITLHGQAHDRAQPDIGKGGFPHRHVPEDMTIFTGIR